MSRLTRRTLLFLTLGCATVGLGCGQKGPPTGTVKGRVLIGGQPPAEPIRVQFINSIIGQGSDGLTDKDGAFELREPLRVDEYTVYFERLVDYSGGAVSTAKEMLTTVPKEYRTESSSPLKEQVRQGENNVEINVPGA